MWKNHGFDFSQRNQVEGLLDYLSIDKKDKRNMQTTTLPLAFDAEDGEGLTSSFDETYFLCKAHYKEAKNGELVEFVESTRWPKDDELVRVLRKI